MRGKRAKKRTIVPDAKYNSALVSKFINYLMYDGKKETATKLVYDALESIDPKELKTVTPASDSAKKEKGKDDKEEAVNKKLSPLEIFETAIGNVKPKLEIRSRRIGGANYQVPVPVNPDRQVALAMRWILGAARERRKNTSFDQALKTELVAAYNREGTAIKKKEDVQKMAEANKAFAQFA